MAAFLAEAAAALAVSDNAMADRMAARLAPLAGHAPLPRFADARALAHLDAAIAAPFAHPLARTAGAIARHLAWEEVDPLLAPPRVVGGHAYCEIVGPDGLLRAADYRVGLFVSAPDIDYPSHSHEAEEIFFVLGGTADWRQADGRYRPQPPGALIHHVPRQRHGTRTRAEPIFVIWAWDGDIGFESYTFHPEDEESDASVR